MNGESLDGSLGDVSSLPEDAPADQVCAFKTDACYMPFNKARNEAVSKCDPNNLQCIIDADTKRAEDVKPCDAEKEKCLAEFANTTTDGTANASNTSNTSNAAPTNAPSQGGKRKTRKKKRQPAKN